jgi:hypothetical protein
MQQIFGIMTEINADKIADRECMKQMMAEMNAKTDGKQEEMLARMREDIKSGQAEMRSTLDVWLMDLKDGRKETTACNGATETEPNPGIMQSIQEHQEIPKEEAAVMPVGEPRKRCRVCNLAADRCQKRKERIRGNRGSRRKSAAACRKLSRHAKVAWRKRNIARNECTRANVVQEIQRGRTFGRRHQQEPEYSNGIRS